MSALLSQEQLMEWTGFERAGDLEKWLKSRNIRYEKGKGKKIVTTQAAIDKVFCSTIDDHQEPFQL